MQKRNAFSLQVTKRHSLVNVVQFPEQYRRVAFKLRDASETFVLIVPPISFFLDKENISFGTFCSYDFSFVIHLCFLAFPIIKYRLWTPTSLHENTSSKYQNWGSIGSTLTWLAPSIKQFVTKIMAYLTGNFSPTWIWSQEIVDFIVIVEQVFERIAPKKAKQFWAVAD